MRHYAVMGYLVIMIAVLLGIVITLGGDCLCCGCALCDEPPGTLQATLDGIDDETDGCLLDESIANGISCTAINGVYPLTPQSPIPVSELPDSILTAAEPGTSACYWLGNIAEISCTTQNCVDCKAEACVTVFGDEGFSDPDQGTCEANCTQYPILGAVSPPGAGEYRDPENPAVCDDGMGTGCTYDEAVACEYELTRGGVQPECACTFNGVSGEWECGCTGPCTWNVTCGNQSLGVIRHYLYKEAATLDVVSYTRIEMPHTNYPDVYHGETVFTDQDSLDCPAEFAPLTQALTLYDLQNGLCTAPTSVDLEFA